MISQKKSDSMGHFYTYLGRTPGWGEGPVNAQPVIPAEEIRSFSRRSSPILNPSAHFALWQACTPPYTSPTRETA